MLWLQLSVYLWPGAGACRVLRLQPELVLGVPGESGADVARLRAVVLCDVAMVGYRIIDLKDEILVGQTLRPD